ncbi:hypothetical protein ASC66_01115 [Leifsonia sp. Root4]|uniref:hypothetical protein n=1 Tax=Leifsonia sp. Root4 TaxID=1736525 RepID=UPI0006FBDBBE|nr:hypothetical protein [Leifsonia sp. Root4]KQW07628.1 hypothetical protein ASC66_01115 [Leifsonia sp. Root4]
MNIENEFEQLKTRTERVANEATALRKRIRAAQLKTESLLGIAQSLGVNVVSIGMIHEAVANEGWDYRGRGSIFTHPNARVDGWPAAWRIAEQAGVGYGAGNTGQHQADLSSLIDGVYECRGGRWMRIDLDESGQGANA